MNTRARIKLVSNKAEALGMTFDAESLDKITDKNTLSFLESMLTAMDDLNKRIINLEK